MLQRDETVLLTGGTGNLGRRLAWLLASAGNRVDLLVRRASRRGAREWLAALRLEDPLSAGRILLVNGDLTSRSVINSDERSRVLEDCVSVLHCGAVTASSAGRALAWRTNVEGTRNLLALAAEMPQLRRFLHVSDLAVAGSHSGVFTESDLLRGQLFRSSYAETKMLAERIARSAMTKAPVTVVRLASFLPDRTRVPLEGLAGRNAPLLRLLDFIGHWGKWTRGGLPIPALPLGSCARVQALPLGWQAEVLGAAWASDETSGQTIQLVDPDAPTLREVVEEIGPLLGLKSFGVDVPRRVWALARTLPGFDAVVGHIPRGSPLSPTQLERFVRCSVPEFSHGEALVRSMECGVPRLREGLPSLCEYVRTHDVDSLHEVASALPPA